MIGVFGGTFDPPHLGHLILADEARHALGLEFVLWVPVGDPPHKSGGHISPAQQRAQLVQAAIEGDPGFRLSSVDLERPGPHYTIDGLRVIKEEYTEYEFAYLMGGDSLEDLPTWHQPRALLELCSRLGVLRRPGADPALEALEFALPGITDKTTFFEAPLVGIAGIDIRRRVNAGRPYRYLVLPRVADLIDTLGLYR